MCTIAVNEKRWIRSRLVGQSKTPLATASAQPPLARISPARQRDRRQASLYQVTYQAGRTALSNPLMQAVHAPLLRSALPLLAFTRQPQLSLSFAGLPLLKAPISPQTLIPDFTLPLITTAPPLLLVLVLLVLLLLLLPPHITAPTTTTTATTISSTHTTA